MVRNCSELLKDSSLLQDNDFRTGSQIHPLNDGQRFWFLADSEDSPKICTYVRDLAYADRDKSLTTRLSHDDSFETVTHTGSSDVSLPTGAIVQVYTPTELSELTDSERETEPVQWPATAHYDKGYTFAPSEVYEKLFRGLDVSTAVQRTESILYSLNMHQSQAEALYNGLLRLHSNGHYKYFAEDTKRLYLDFEAFQHDTIEFYIISDDIFLVGDRLPFISHGNISGSISTGTRFNGRNSTPQIDYPKLKEEAVFFCYRFRYTIASA